jgi:HrpA-like RNA helicase
MRTTVELPSDLMRAAKARSAESGESLKALLTRAVAAELATAAAPRSHKARVKLPLFGSPRAARVRVSSADLERALGDADAASAGPKRRRRPRR